LLKTFTIRKSLSGFAEFVNMQLKFRVVEKGVCETNVGI